MNWDDPYLYPNSSVLRNCFDIRDQALLDERERRFVTIRMLQGPPEGRFDGAHLRAIHRHLFGDIFDWAGDFRTVEIAKGGSQFQFVRFIPTGLADIHSRLVASGYLQGLKAEDFARAAAPILGDLNYVHPFRDGNGRTQVEYLRQLAFGAGRRFAPARIDPQGWIEASRSAHHGDYEPFAREIARCLE